MKKQTFTPPSFRTSWLRLLLVFFLSSSLAFWGCDKAEETVQPEGLSVTQVQNVKSGKEKEDKDDKYKTDKTGQYVSKDVQVTGYEDGSERPTRPKFDAADAIFAMTLDGDNPYEEPCCGEEPGGGGTTVTSNFVSSEDKGLVNGSIYIHNLLFVKDSNPLPSPESGYIRLDVDLNKGAGGKYIYLEFTRDPNSVKKEHPDYDLRNEPITDFKAIAYNTGLSEWTAPPNNYSYIYEHTPSWALTSYKIIDLNDGAGGKYIYGYQSRNFVVYGNSIKEVGILYGNSSSIQPPSGWIKQPQDLNEGAGGDYIYFCYKK